MFSQLKHYSAMGLVYVILVFLGALGLELAEGMNVKTTEYYGLMNLGGMYYAILFFFTCVPAVLVYVLAIVPLSVLLRRGGYGMFLLRTAIFIGIGGIAGRVLFYGNFQDHLISEYGLKELTAVVIFGACGLAYSLIDSVLASRASWLPRKSRL
ncbi:MAG TPA: hypothetical protein VEZ72_21660 [Paenibacillus sp.]|nr:hypothetical protein [Paenibacillus sp.]